MIFPWHKICDSYAPSTFTKKTVNLALEYRFFGGNNSNTTHVPRSFHILQKSPQNEPCHTVIAIASRNVCGLKTGSRISTSQCHKTLILLTLSGVKGGVKINPEKLPTLRIMGSQVTGGDWRSKRTLRKTESNPSFLEAPMILRVCSLFAVFGMQNTPTSAHQLQPAEFGCPKSS